MIQDILNKGDLSLYDLKGSDNDDFMSVRGGEERCNGLPLKSWRRFNQYNNFNALF